MLNRIYLVTLPNLRKTQVFGRDCALRKPCELGELMGGQMSWMPVYDWKMTDVKRYATATISNIRFKNN